MKYYILALISAFGLSACSLIGESGSDCPDIQPEKSETIALSFKMISANIGSRADASHPETDSEWAAFEDLIDINNFAFYIFLDNDDTKPLVMKMTDIAGSTDPNSMITGAFGAYTVTTVIPKQNLENLLGRELDINSTAPVKFRIVLLANTNPKPDYNLLAPADPINSETPTTYDQFMEDANALVFNLNAIYNPVDNDGGVDGIYKGTIPMFGMSTFTTTEEQLYLSRPEERIYLGDIYMLRSLAKIRVIDNATRTDGSIYPYIESVTVDGSTNMAYQVPAGVNNANDAIYGTTPDYVNGQQVHTPRIHTISETNNNTTYRLGTPISTTAGTAKGTTRFGYIPEQAISGGKPVIHVTARLDANRTKTYDIPMDGSGEIKPTPETGTETFGTYILRNHIYTLSVNSIAVGTPAEITLSVQPWTEYSTELDYSDNVTVERPLEWVSGTYQGSVNMNDGIVFIRPWATSGDTDMPQPLEGVFGIQTPVGATWSASFIFDPNSYGAFAFLKIDPNDPEKKAFLMNEDGTYQTFYSISSEIDGKTLSNIYIVSTNPYPSENQRARLQIIVALRDEQTVVEADMAPDKSYMNYTIVQNQ